MRKSVAAGAVLAVSLGLGLAVGPAGALDSPSVDLMPGAEYVGTAVIGDDAVWTLGYDPTSGGSGTATMLFTRSLGETESGVTLGRSTRVARASGISMAEHDGTLAYSRRADGALVLRAPDGTETVPSWGKTAAFIHGGPSSLSSDWVVALGTVVNRQTGVAYDLLGAVDVPADSDYAYVGDARVTDDRAVWTVHVSWPDVLGWSSFVYTVELGADGPVGPALQLDEAADPNASVAAIGIIGDQILWSETTWPGYGVTVRSVPSDAPGSAPAERTYGEQDHTPRVLAAGDSVAVWLHNPAAIVWLDPTLPTTDLRTFDFAADNLWPIAARDGLLALRDTAPVGPDLGRFVDADGRTVTADESLPVPPPMFPDVSAGNPFATNITWLTDLGITRGYADGTFRPSGSVNRDAMAAFLYRLAGEPTFTPPATSPFIDVATSHPFYTEISWLASTGISTGTVTSAGAYYKPGDPVSREAMAAFLHRFAGTPDWGTPTTSPFLDVSTGHPFYAAIAWMSEAEISTGTVTPAGAYYKPGDPVSREAMAAFMSRLHSGGNTISWHGES